MLKKHHERGVLMINQTLRPKINDDIPLSISDIDLLIAKLTMKTQDWPTISMNGDSRSLKERIAEITQKVEEATRQLRDIFKTVKWTGNVPIAVIKRDIIPIISQAAEFPHVFYLYEEMKQRDEYTYRHNICVGVIAAYIGKWAGLTEQQLSELTLAATLHDVGKMMVKEEILHKPGKLTAAEYEQVKLHTVYGYGLLKKIPNLPPSIALTALQHHERENGGGYPLQLKGDNTHLYAKIVAIADVFHAMSSKRVYHDAMPFYKVIKQMKEDVFGTFDPTLLLIFLNKIMKSLVGKEVLLTNQKIGRIIMIDPYDPINSLIQSDNQIIDLRFQKDIQIERVLGV